MTSVGGTPVPPSVTPTEQHLSFVDSVPFEYLNQDVIQNWESSGETSIETLATQAIDDKKFDLLISIFYEVLSSCTNSLLSVEHVIPVLRKIMVNQETENANGNEEDNGEMTGESEAEKERNDGNLEIISTTEFDLTALQLFLHTFSLFPLSQPLKDVILGLEIRKSRLLLFLDPQVSMELGVTDSMFEKRIIRTNTNMLYKQKRFNLLREESEGYSKLIVEVHQAMSSPANPSKAAGIAKTIESLIGYFDLDPLRSLDIILDVAAANLAENADLFLLILKNSPWWPKTLAEPRSLSELGNGGNKVAAQLLGFKFKSYTSDQATPESLAMLTAFLIKQGFVSLGDVYESLSPSDKELEDYEEIWKQDMDQQASKAKASALALAAPLEPLEPEGGDSSTDKNGKKERNSKKPNSDNVQDEKLVPQKVLLLKSLLSIGSVYPSLFILGKFPYIANAFPDLSDLILRLVDYSVGPLYEKNIAFTPTEEACVTRALPKTLKGNTTLGLPKRGARHKTIDPLKAKHKVNVGQSYEFFYKEWYDELTQIDDLDGLNYLTENYLKFAGPLLGRHPVLVVKLCRIGANSISTTTNEDDQYWLEYFRLYILPAISLIEDNPAAIHEIYTLMGRFSFEARYALFGEWHSVLSKSSPHLKIATSKAEKGTKDVLKRLSKTNVKEMMRKLAKLSYSNPIPCFTVFIGQVESYDNLGDLVVDAARYFTDLGWDVLPYVIMTQLTSGRGTYQVDGLNDRKWIQSLASFTAKLCRRYSSMDPRPILLYVLRQLHVRNTSDIIVLKELISQMAGVQQLSNITISQVEGLGGGVSLQKSVYELIDDKREDSAKSGKQLVDSLVNLDIVSELFIAISQLHVSYIHSVSEDLAHQKFLAYRYDDLTHLLNQYIDMINHFADLEQFHKSILPISELCMSYGVKPSWAFGLWRNTLGEEIRKYDQTAKRKDNSAPPLEEKEREKAEEEVEEQDVEMADATQNDTSETTVPETEVWHPLLQKTIQDIVPVLPENEWKYLKPGFYVTFWQLSLYDIQYPEKKYEAQESKIKEQVSALDDSIKALEPQQSTRSNSNGVITDKIRSKKAERESSKQDMIKISAENKRHALHYKKCLSRLEKEKDHWFSFDQENIETPTNDQKESAEGVRPGVFVRRNQTRQLLTQCILPRALHSPVDAVFCARFVEILHILGTVNFSTLTFFDKLFADGILYGTLLTCTPYEAENLGIFLSELLRYLARWHKDEKVYETEGRGRTTNSETGKDTFLPGMQMTYELGEVKEETLLDYDQFSRALEKWHRHTANAAVDCLKSEDYMQRRNTIILLKNMISVFPVITNQGYMIADAVEEITENDQREDLKLSAVALFGHINNRSSEWIPIYEFKKCSEAVKQRVIEEIKERTKLKQEKNKPKMPIGGDTESTSSKPASKSSSRQPSQPAGQSNEDSSHNERIRDRERNGGGRDREGSGAISYSGRGTPRKDDDRSSRRGSRASSREAPPNGPGSDIPNESGSRRNNLRERPVGRDNSVDNRNYRDHRRDRASSARESDINKGEVVDESKGRTEYGDRSGGNNNSNRRPPTAAVARKGRQDTVSSRRPQQSHTGGSNSNRAEDFRSRLGNTTTTGSSNSNNARDRERQREKENEKRAANNIELRSHPDRARMVDDQGGSRNRSNTSGGRTPREREAPRDNSARDRDRDNRDRDRDRRGGTQHHHRSQDRRTGGDNGGDSSSADANSIPLGGGRGKSSSSSNHRRGESNNNSNSTQRRDRRQPPLPPPPHPPSKDSGGSAGKKHERDGEGDTSEKRRRKN